MFLLGNLTLKEMEQKAGVTFPQELINILQDTREEMTASVKGRRVWHCYELPFMLAVGQMQFAEEINGFLQPLSKDFKSVMQIGIDE